MGIGAAIGGVASLAGGILGSNAAGNAASDQEAASLNAQKNTVATQNYINAAFQPYVDAGGRGLEDLTASLGMGGPGTNMLAANGISGLTFQPTQAQLAATPGYQFALAQGQQATANSNAAQGRGISGAALKGAANYATGLASQTLGQQDQIFQNNLGNVLNPLQSLTNVGQGAINTEAGVNTSLTGQNSALVTGAGNAAASGAVGSANALTGALNGIGSAGQNYLLYNNLLGGGGGGGGGLSSVGESDTF